MNRYMPTLIKQALISTTVGVFALLTSFASADDGNYITGTSLAVKERLKSLEQINVTAEKEVLDIEPESAAVKQLLAELDALDSETSED